MKSLGRDYVKVICSVCRGEFYQKDTVLVTDKYNLQYGQLVCKEDLDKINEQVLPNNIHERPISHPELLRPDLTPQFTLNANDDRVPSAPKFPLTKVNPFTAEIDLYWQGPDDVGSSNIIGYKIARAHPQLGSYEIIVENTNVNQTYYTDETGDISLEYSYKVAAINDFGVGPYSEEFFWPVRRVTYSEVVYLVDGNGNALDIGGNIYIRTFPINGVDF